MEPELIVKHIDFDEITDEISKSILSDLNEEYSENFEHQVAYRKNERLVPRLNHFNPNESGKENSMIIESNASYLITGGHGGLGLLFSNWLIEQGARHIVLMSRRSASDEVEVELVDGKWVITDVPV